MLQKLFSIPIRNDNPVRHFNRALVLNVHLIIGLDRTARTDNDEEKEKHFGDCASYMDHLQLTKTGRSVSLMLSLNPRIKCAAAILFIFVSALYLNFTDCCAILGSYLTWDQFELR